MGSNLNSQNLLAISDGRQDTGDQNTGTQEERICNVHVLLKRADLQANLGNWEAVLADAITARELDPRSADAWTLCARAGLAGGDADAALDCVHEALHIDHSDRKVCTLLESVVKEHLNETLEMHTNNYLPLEGEEEQFTEEKLRGLSQFWCFLNKKTANEKLSADQIEQANSIAIDLLNIIGELYQKLHEYRWALACHFLSFFKSRYLKTRVHYFTKK